MIKLSLYVLAATILCCSCSNSTSDKMVSEEATAGNDSMEYFEYPGRSHFADTLTTGQYHQMILDAIANGDKSGKWKLSMLMLAWPVD